MKTNTIQTVAEEIAYFFDNDGLNFHSNGQCLCDVAEARSDRVETHFEKTRYIFDDGSIITVAEDAWDFGFEGCYCFASAGHRDDCERK